MLQRAAYLMLIMMLMIVSGCAAASETEADESVSEAAKEFQVSLSPSPAVILKENKLVLTLTAAQQQEWGNATVTVKLGMEEMDHGEEVVTAVSTGAGNYEATVIPTMAGRWNAYIMIAGDQFEKKVMFSFEAGR